MTESIPLNLYQTLAMLDTMVTGRWWLYFTKDKKGRLKWRKRK